MRGIVLKPFPWSADGIKVEQLRAGDERDFQPDLFPGLERAGHIRTPEQPADAGGPDHSLAGPGAPDSGGSTGGLDQSVAAGGGTPPDDGGTEPGGPADAGGPPASAHVEAQAGAVAIKHVGRGKYALFRGEERLTEDPLEKDEAEAELAKLKG